MLRADLQEYEVFSKGEALSAWESFRGHLTEPVKDLLARRKVDVAVIPCGLSSRFAARSGLSMEENSSRVDSAFLQVLRHLKCSRLDPKTRPRGKKSGIREENGDEDSIHYEFETDSNRQWKRRIGKRQNRIKRFFLSATLALFSWTTSYESHQTTVISFST